MFQSIMIKTSFSQKREKKKQKKKKIQPKNKKSYTLTPTARNVRNWEVRGRLTICKQNMRGHDNVNLCEQQ